jgi:carbonic anhydrase
MSRKPGAKAVEITYRYQSDATPRERPADAQAARARLDAGNRAFASLLDDLNSSRGMPSRVIEVDAHELGFGEDHGTPRQHPYAAVLGCADARVPLELVFNEGPNDLFVVRVAGNVLGNDVLASLKYAIDHLGGSLRLVVVLGHSGCGAVSAAVDTFLDPAKYVALSSQHLLRGLLDRLLFVVHASASAMASALGPDVVKCPGYRRALIEVAAASNAALAAHTVQQQLGDVSGVRAVFGVYVLSSHRVWAPRAGSGETKGLADPPADMAGFGAFRDAVLRSERIVALLGDPQG